MNRLGTLAGSAMVLALALAGCGKTPPFPTPTTPTAPASSASVSPSAPPTSAKPSPTPSASALTLAGDGIADLPFGTAQAEVVKVITARVGKPTTSMQGQSCELDASSPWAETVVYDDLWVQFSAKTTKKSSPRTLTAWGFQLNKALPKPWAMADGVPLNLTFNQLKAKYPAAKYIKLGLPDGTKALELPNKLMFLGVGKPEVVRAGELTLCE
ncbi:hypothetical protein [Propionicimonas sp.]|uniref:hypothetical protein n=1 Tax=Propionicimonas sp. TaxID=1955623 RepID=UPI0018420E6E|nr:hypothetical protein [Propionicimonas sp.]MBU3975774.1 hypothetical protein [Actinomycetota bacterium]MBA3022236.1 hypothetical protein [Propionicimonas sp.]MBU3987664.1 hypothetical protein [Actinomycetota bacterium]MBU4007698.1 hypothetical protein [Actinomycetota bacterium]MBU4065336.1 hypothetical protein [Actinomycetota bacterium]